MKIYLMLTLKSKVMKFLHPDHRKHGLTLLRQILLENPCSKNMLSKLLFTTFPGFNYLTVGIEADVVGITPDAVLCDLVF